jgi:hypothetical protein
MRSKKKAATPAQKFCGVRDQMLGPKWDCDVFTVPIAPMPYQKSILTELTTAVCKEYADDASNPSVILSLLDDGFYASVRRYPRNRTSFVVCSTRGHNSPDVALRALAKEWLGASEAKDALRAALT